MRQWWNKLPMYDKEGQSGRRATDRPLITGYPPRQRQHQEEPDDDDGDGSPPIKKSKKKVEVEFEEVTIGGKKFRVEKGGGEAINKLVTGGQRKPVSEEARLRAMFEEYMGAPKKPTKKKVASESDDDDEGDVDELEMFSDPKKFVKKLTENLTKQITQQIRGEYSADQGQKTFWANFYRRNDDLEEHDFIVRAVLNDNLNELKEVEVGEASKRLAELTRERLLEIAKKVTKGKSKKNGTHIEGSGSARQSRDDDDEVEDQDAADEAAGMPLTLGGMLKLRREQRRKPRHSEGEE